ncbi:MAG: 23S rRNA (uracil(1939)-C(5))-methyltransferase RlmD [Thermoflavifilum sp.]|nr:23S rRNA (uracil(1939)-C(5))-methyltransferase RlmD [Thermoflavifilum sp.]
MRVSRSFQRIEQVPVLDYAAEGRALARIDGKVVFIEGGAMPGDEVDVHIVKNRKDWAIARVVRFRKYAQQRVQPFCQHFGVCGGCAWQMLPYEQQLAYKRRQVEEVFSHIGQLQFPGVEPVLPADPVVKYRNKAEFTASDRAFIPRDDEHHAEHLPGPALGYHIAGRFDRVLNIYTCDLLPEAVNEVRNRVRDFLVEQQKQRSELLFYHIRNHTGWFRGISIRVNKQQELMVNLVMTYEDPLLCRALCDMLQQEIPQLDTLYYTINFKKNDSLHDLEPVLVSGKGYLLERLGKYVFKIGPKSFFQTNSYQAEKLYEQVKHMANLSGREIVYDLYCGTGSIGIYLANGAAQVVGIEQVKEAVADARENARLNGCTQVHVYAGDVTELYHEALVARHGPPDVVIVDPPRAGMHPQLIAQLLQMQPPVVIYVSCNPATQARDLQWLQQLYRIDRVQPVDMFPHTHHIENIVKLSKIYS